MLQFYYGIQIDKRKIDRYVIPSLLIHLNGNVSIYCNKNGTKIEYG